MSESEETVANPEEQKSAGMPLFYENPVPISFERHGKKHLARRVDARFAAKSNAIPINLSEFAQISRHYPIAFVAAAVPFPVAVVGMRNGENLFVDKKANGQRTSMCRPMCAVIPLSFPRRPAAMC
ncbi:SapC family protein [Tepidicaulis marinus]|uniref:SapC family protein n=1 Tax=Tepidicaulis marinus TaxID=1333998 RepID=A0A081BDR8_9HYPH|nr:SapC family protein [Tepidicaulis marinus]GAK46186.1 SapC family protein [Tepidicaulis marinus]